MAPDTVQLDLDVVLPEAHDARDRCVAHLISALDSLDGVSSIHVIDEAEAPAGKPQICLHLESGAVSLTRLEERVRAAGADVSDRYGHLVVQARPAGHASRARALTERVRAVPGVIDGTVTVDGLVRVEYDQSETTESAIRSAIARLGAGAEDDVDGRDHGHAHDHGGRGYELAIIGIAAVVYLVARFLDWFSDLDGLVIGLYIVAAVLTGVFVARDAWLSLRARVFDIDQLMLVAAIGAATLGHWSDTALLLVLFSLGHALEGYAMNRARRSIEALGELAPATARRRDEPGVEVPVESLAVDDIVLVRPHERIPADGVIVAGTTTIDESAVTGESIPVDAGPDHGIYAGTLNGSGAIEVRVAKVAADSTLARVAELVADAETQLSPSQRLTKRIVRVFVPAVFALVAVVLIVGPLLGASFAEAFGRAMAVLVAASPCALAIATPSAVLAAIGRAARSGILVKGGGPLEALGAVTAIAFDKTGTITEGQPVLSDVIPAAGVTANQLLAVSLAVERNSDHPIARAVVAGAEAAIGSAVDAVVSDVEAVTGRGLVALVDGEPATIGAVELLDAAPLGAEVASAREHLKATGRTTMVVSHGGRVLGVLGVMDTPRAEARTTIDQLRRLGIETIVMLSGDSQPVATAVAEQVGIAEARGGLMPEDKVAAIEGLTADRLVAMVGDGVNDAPALAAANVGIAMGAAGSDVALETADIALMADRLERLPVAVGLARRASATIRQNLFFSLAVVVVLVPLTLLGVGISAAVIAHEGSTLVVVANALRLMRTEI